MEACLTPIRNKGACRQRSCVDARIGNLICAACYLILGFWKVDIGVSLMKTKFATLATIAILTAACSGNSGIVGKYTSPDGSSADFLGDGTAVFAKQGNQRIWKWSTYDGNRIKLEPASPILGVEAAMCNYELSTSSLRVTGCEYAMLLNRI